MKTGSILKTFKNVLLTILFYHAHIFMVVYGVLVFTLHPFFVVPFALYAWRSFRGTQDLLYVVGPLYWIMKNDSRLFSVGVGTMHEVASPWRTGRGLYITVAKRCLQVGLCRTQTLDETDGILSAVRGRYLDMEPREIGNWNGVQKEDARKLTA